MGSTSPLAIMALLATTAAAVAPHLHAGETGSTAPSRTSSRGPERAAVETALERGGACLARDLDGGAFRDPYLTYVYPDETPLGPPGAPRLTYRQVDADVILVLIGRQGPVPAPLAPVVSGAEATLRAAAPLWRGRGFSNTRRSPRSDGIALDTYCIAGWLLGDDAMAAEAAAAIDADRWLPPGWYEEVESFRASADEAWCLRLLASTGRFDEAADRVLDRIVSEFRSHQRADPAGTAAFYEAWHLGMVLAEIPSRASVRGAHWGALRDEITGALRVWAESHPGHPAPDSGGRPASSDGADVLEWVNLATAELIDAPTRRQAIEVLLARQGDDGCWTIPGVTPPRLGSSFATLRALLALVTYRSSLEEIVSAPPPSPAP